MSKCKPSEGCRKYANGECQGLCGLSDKLFLSRFQMKLNQEKQPSQERTWSLPKGQADVVIS
jgi:hypothetical protein